MKKLTTYKKLRIANFINILQLIVFIIIIPCLCMLHVEKRAAVVPDILICILLACFNTYFVSLYTNYFAYGKCDIYAYQLWLNKAVRISTGTRVELIELYAALGWKDRVWHEMQSLNAVPEKLSDIQKIRVEYAYIDYVNPEMAEQYLTQLSNRLKRIKVTIINSVKIRCMENKIHFRECMLKKEWEKAIEILQEFSQNLVYESVYEQVVRAYWTGICYLNLGKKNEAVAELQFVSKYGGTTKYVIWAGNILNRMHIQEQGAECKDPVIKRRRSVWGGIVLTVALIGFGIFISNFKLYGETVEEAYRLKYNVSDKQDVLVLYERNVGNQKMAIIYHKGEIVYCVLNQDREGKKYKIQDVYQDDVNSTANYLANIDSQLIGQENIKVKKKDFIKWEVSILIQHFYQKKGLFEKKPDFCAGIYCDPIIEGLVIDGVPAEVEEIKYKDMIFYLWVADGIDYELVKDKDILIAKECFRDHGREIKKIDMRG